MVWGGGGGDEGDKYTNGKVKAYYVKGEVQSWLLFLLFRFWFRFRVQLLQIGDDLLGSLNKTGFHLVSATDQITAV